MVRFKDLYSSEIRKRKSSDIINKYPGYYPVVIEPASDKTPMISNTTFILSKNAKLPTVIREIRKRVNNVRPEDALFVFVGSDNNAHLVSNSSTIEEIYNKYKDKDGFLYFRYSLENTFG